MCILLKSDQKQYDTIIQSIKENYLSQSSMPKLLLGTGLSVTYKLPGMEKLYKELVSEFVKCTDEIAVTMWESKKDAIEENGLEEGLASIIPSEQPLIDQIRRITANYILEEENKLFDEIYRKETGFKKLLAYLKDTCSVNERILDIMTPNYDRIVEIVCDSLNIDVITGFGGENIGSFNPKILKNPEKKYNVKSNFFVRLFKPHGSLNWISMDGKTVLTNDNRKLLENSQSIEIITPGSSKYKDGMVNNAFRCMREDFNEVLDNTKNYSLFIFGYGFNDAQFDTVLYEYFDHNTLIVSKGVKDAIVEMGLSNGKMVIFYQRDNKNYMIYKCQKYEIENSMWDINEFASTLIG